MSKVSVLTADRPYTFSDYFSLNADIEDILGWFGYHLTIQPLSLPCSQQSLPRLADLSQRLNESLPHISLTSEAARREFLIAPVLMELIHYTQAKLKVEYALTVTDQLKGSLDYLLQTDQQLLVIEAKNADLQRGFTQLAVELIALDQWSPSDQPIFYGAVTMGNIWQFGRLERSSQQITQGLNLYRVPEDLEMLLRILVGILMATVTDQEVALKPTQSV
jgi:hypothetical protein